MDAAAGARRTEPGWVADAIWWQVHPLAFVGAEPEQPEQPGGAQEVAHRLPRITAWLDHAVALGCNGLALGPVFASQTHGYDTVDHLRLDPRLGDDDDFDQLVEAAHAKGMTVLLDGVFNHVGRAHPAWAAVEREGRAASTASWFRLHGDGDDLSPDVFEGHAHLVELDHEEPAVAEHVIEVMCHWLGRGADGWRLDAAYAVPPQFWARVLPEVRERFPHAYVVGEVIHGDYAGVVAASGMDAVTQYELWQGIWHGLRDGNLFETGHALERHDGFMASFVPWTFVGNHDVTRIVDQVGDDLLAHALVLWATLGGTPAVWSGDELGWHGIKEQRPGGDDAVRPEFPADPADALGGEVFTLHRELIGLRRRHRWLHGARTTVLHRANEQLVYRSEADGQALLVALNASAAPATVPGAAPGPGDGSGTADGWGTGAGEVVAGAAGHQDGRLDLAGHGWAVLELR